MYYNGQTLRKKKTNILVKLATTDARWHWGNTKKTKKGDTLFFDEEGKKFCDFLNNYEPIYNELGQIAPGLVRKNKPDLRLKKYYNITLQKKELSLKKWEKVLLEQMNTENTIICPFANGSVCLTFEDYFLKNRNAKPLYMKYDSYDENWKSGPMTFMYNNKQWLYDYQVSRLIVIKME